MKTTAKIFILTILLGGMIAISSCGKDGSCPGGTYDTFSDCADAIDGQNDTCECVEKNGDWTIVGI